MVAGGDPGGIADVAASLFFVDPHLADLLQIAAGVPADKAVGYLVGFATSGASASDSPRAAILCFGGTSAPMLIVLNILAYTAFFAAAMYLNALGRSGARAR